MLRTHLPRFVRVTTMSRWEYLLFVQMRDWSVAGAPITSWIAGPGDCEYKTHESTSSLVILQELGEEGWELIANPDNFSTIVGIQGLTAAGTVASLDGADWFRREFWLKRAAQG